MSTSGRRPFAAITGIGPVSRDGIGLAELAESAQRGRSTGEVDAYPTVEGGVGATASVSLQVRELTNFEPKAHLGKRGWLFMPPATRAALVAANFALRDAGVSGEGAHRTGVAIGTNFAVTEVSDRIDRALLTGGVKDITPMDCPNFSVNVPASEVAIASGLRAFNITLVNLLTAGCEAVWLAARALRDDRADTVLAGAIEGLPPATAGAVLGSVVDASSACLLHLERPEAAQRRGARVYAHITAGTQRVLPIDDSAAACILSAALDEVCRPAPARVHLFVPATVHGTDVADLASSLLSAYGNPRLTISRGAPQASTTSLLWLAGVLANGEPGWVADGRCGLDEEAGTAASDLVFGVVNPYGQLVLIRLAPA